MLKRFLLIFLYLPVFGQVESIKEDVSILCSPTFHGRGYVENGDEIAANYLAQRFKQIGLKPLKNSYFQNFRFDVNSFPGSLHFIIDQDTLIPGIDYLIDPGCPNFNGNLNPKSLSFEICRNQEKLIAEIKQILTQKEFNAVLLDFRTTPKDSLALIRGIGEEIAQILPVVEWVNQKLTWSVSQEQLNFPLVQLHKDSLKLQDIRLAIEAKLVKDHESKNVIACIKSKKKKAKTIVFTAHYDHLGRMGKSTYFPGANDNASGVATLLAMAEKCMKNPIQHYNIVFIAFAGEEVGLLGSKYFVEHPLMDLKKIQFLINLDIMGSGEDGITVVNATLFNDAFQALTQTNADGQFLSQIKSRGPAANSDHYWFTQKQVPSFFIYTMGPNKNYHDVHDTYENLTFAKSNALVELLYQFAAKL